MVILETALGIGVLAVVAVILLSATKVGLGELSVVAAARDAALQAARGHPAAAVAADVARRLPDARVAVRSEAGSVTVTVSRPWGSLPLVGALAPSHRASATARIEPGARPS